MAKNCSSHSGFHGLHTLCEALAGRLRWSFSCCCSQRSWPETSIWQLTRLEIGLAGWKSNMSNVKYLPLQPLESLKLVNMMATLRKSARASQVAILHQPVAPSAQTTCCIILCMFPCLEKGIRSNESWEKTISHLNIKWHSFGDEQCWKSVRSVLWFFLQNLRIRINDGIRPTAVNYRPENDDTTTAHFICSITWRGDTLTHKNPLCLQY